ARIGASGLQRLHHEARRVVFLGVDVKDFTGDVRPLRRRQRLPRRERGGTECVFNDYGLTGLPKIFLDTRRRVVSQVVGEIDREDRAGGIVSRAR
ncbi:MAG: hypothetical protein H0T39_15745, partial [Actinobacteria bacterium]|nr:hypothetical protein [Actinomycetota bacterium]